MNLAVRLVSGGGVGVASATGVALVGADAVGLGVDRVKLLSPFLHPVTKSGTTHRNTNKQRRIQICRRYITAGRILKRRIVMKSGMRIADCGMKVRTSHSTVSVYSGFSFRISPPSPSCRTVPSM